MMTTQAIAWEFEGMTFCPGCALVASNGGMVAAGQEPASTMDDLYATLQLMFALADRDYDGPKPVYVARPAVSQCDNCENAIPAGDAA